MRSRGDIEEAPPGQDRLQLKVQPGAIKHLGISLYHRPADVVSELVANAWDADASSTRIEVDKQNKEILISDDGIGMTYLDVQNLYLQMGRDRRAETGETRTQSGRPILGRKGIGKFSGLGIAQSIEVSTVSRKTKELTIFEMAPDFSESSSAELEDLISYQKWLEPDSSRTSGTTVKLKRIHNSLDDEMLKRFKRSLSRRFLLSDNASEIPFVITVNGEELDQPFSEEKQFEFPRDLTDEEKVDLNVQIVDEEGWAVTDFEGHSVLWRVGYSDKPIKDEELRGIAIFAHGKLAQSAFFFDQQGGSSADLAKEYITGQVKMDFVDEELDLISPERQRLQFESEIGTRIKKWGLSLLGKLNNIWKKRRAEKKLEAVLDDPTDDEARRRISNLTLSEQRTIKEALHKIAQGASKVDESVFKNIANDLITAYEKGRLRRLVDELADLNDASGVEQVLEIVSEAGVLSDLQIGEAIKTKIQAIGELKGMIVAQEKENTVRDFIAERPWIISPKFETFKKETALHKLIKSACDESFFDEDDIYNGRIDLLLSDIQGRELLLLEFMRPGKKVDEDHVQRIKRYVFDVRKYLSSSTTHGTLKKSLNEAWIVAEPANSSYVAELIEECREKNIFFLSWDVFLQNGLTSFSDSLGILKERNADPRIEAL